MSFFRIIEQSARPEYGPLPGGEGAAKLHAPLSGLKIGRAAFQPRVDAADFQSVALFQCVVVRRILERQGQDARVHQVCRVDACKGRGARQITFKNEATCLRGSPRLSKVLW